MLYSKNPKEKLEILEKEYQIETYASMKGELDTMCNLADYFEEQGLEKGLEALVTTLKSLLPDFESVYHAVISNETYANITREAVLKYYEK